MWRQGDVLIERVAEIPAGLPKVKRLVLAAGDSTAQRHEIKERGVVHPEHGPIVLKKGTYRVWRQREYVEPGQSPRNVMD
jgi:hypothetical protein